MGRATHLIRLSLIILLLGAAGMAAQWLLRPEGFGKAGHYRYGSLDDIISQVPVHQTKAVCGECHQDILHLHDKDIHFSVPCEDCHGPGNVHVLFHREKDPSVTAMEAAMPKEYTLEGCLFCHRKLEARPRNFPQVDKDRHYAFLHVKDPETRCIECHSPHEPLFLLTAVEEARIHPVIHDCGYCHESRPEKSHREAKDHPVIFACADCHQAIVKDFQDRPHSFMGCTSCHLFHRENDTAGRIFKDGNRRFCQLCHEKKPFKDTEGLPQIEPATHMGNFAKRSGKDPKELEKDPRACLACHMDYIHDPELFKKG